MSNISSNNLSSKDNLKKILSSIQQKGYRNSFLHKDGYIVIKQGTLVKVRIFIDDKGHPAVSTIPIGAKEIGINIIVAIILLMIGGFLVVALFIYLVISIILYFLSLPKSQKLKAEMEEIIAGNI